MAWFRDFYCTCGAYYQASGWGENPDRALAVFESYHEGEGHEPCEPEQARRVRAKSHRKYVKEWEAMKQRITEENAAQRAGLGIV